MPAQPRRRTQAERREHTETALVAAAAEIVVESGVRALTLARVGERAYSRGIVTHHFGSKQGLVDTLASTIQGGFVPGLEEMAPGLERLLALVDGYLHALTTLGTANRAFLLLWAEAASAPELAATFRARDRGFRADLRVDLDAGVAAGEVRADADPEAVAVAIVGQLRGIGMQRLVDPGGVDTEHLRRDVTEQWRRALRPG